MTRRHPFIPDLVALELPGIVRLECLRCGATCDCSAALVHWASAHVLAHTHGGPIQIMFQRAELN